MKPVWIAALVVVAGALAFWVSGYTLHIDKNGFELAGPAHTSPYDAEAEANSPECLGLTERFPEKAFYTSQEMEQRSKATMACIDAKARYIAKKLQSK